VGVTSIVAPTAATAPVVPLAVGIALGEVPGVMQGVGIALAVAGIAITVCRSDPAPSGAALPSIVHGLVCALGFGGFYVAMDAASEGEIPWALLAARTTAVMMFAIARLLRPGRLAMARQDVVVVASIGFLIIGADAMYATASTHGLLGVVAALSTLFPVVTIALARIYLEETVDVRQRVGIATCLSGIAAISAGT
jgi:drug/metabolite transporter (DMT)-like permease